MRCVKCGRLLDEREFWNDCDTCKQCLVDSLDIESPQSILLLLDIPYIKEYWDRYKQLDSKRSALGKYVNLMKLWSFKHYRYEDSDRLN